MVKTVVLFMFNLELPAMNIYLLARFPQVDCGVFENPCKTIIEVQF